MTTTTTAWCSCGAPMDLIAGEGDQGVYVCPECGNESHPSKPKCEMRASRPISCDVIVTHPGRAHRDEFLALSLILSQVEGCRIERRDPTPDDLGHPAVWVVDVGGQYRPGQRNFDHHQDGAEGASLSMVAKYLGVDLSVYQWFDTTIKMDNEGPGAVARHLGIEREQMLPLTDPIGKGVLVQFEACDVIAPSMPGSHYPSHGLYEVMERLGANLIAYAERVSEQIEAVMDLDPLVEVAGVHGLDAAELDGAPEPKAMALVKERVEQAEGVTVAFSVSPDSRGNGLALFRYEEGEGDLDLARLEDRDGVLFAHRGGFLATTQAIDADWRALLREARVHNVPGDQWYLELDRNGDPCGSSNYRPDEGPVVVKAGTYNVPESGRVEKAHDCDFQNTDAASVWEVLEGRVTIGPHAFGAGERFVRISKSYFSVPINLKYGEGDYCLWCGAYNGQNGESRQGFDCCWCGGN